MRTKLSIALAVASAGAAMAASTVPAGAAIAQGYADRLRPGDLRYSPLVTGLAFGVRRWRRSSPDSWRRGVILRVDTRATLAGELVVQAAGFALLLLGSSRGF